MYSTMKLCLLLTLRDYIEGLHSEIAIESDTWKLHGNQAQWDYRDQAQWDYRDQAQWDYRDQAQWDYRDQAR
jgi:hypothetical protein